MKNFGIEYFLKMKRQREESWEMLILGYCAGNSKYIYYPQKLPGQNKLNGMTKISLIHFIRQVFKSYKERPKKNNKYDAKTLIKS